MKNKLIYLMLIVLAISACQKGPQKNIKLKTLADSASYAIGIFLGEQNRQQIDQVPGKGELNLEIMSSAYRQQLMGVEPKMSFEEANEIIGIFFESAAEREAQANLEEGNAFLEKNKNRAGVIVTPSGLQYEIITQGTGEKPGHEDIIQAHYHGTLIDGSVFDSSVERGYPMEFPVNEVIAGWTEGLQLMPVGSKYMFWIPSALAYDPLGPNHPLYGKLLIFEVELLDILK